MSLALLLAAVAGLDIAATVNEGEGNEGEPTC